MRILPLGFAVVSMGSFLKAQAPPTAFRAGDLQVGASFNLGNSDYRNTDALKGFGLYGTFDFKSHFGVDAEFHQLNDPNSKEGVYERSYEIGPRYVLHFGPLSPYARFMVGRGVFNFPPAPAASNGGPAANLAFNMWAGGFGADYTIRPSINIRGDCELQQWSGFPPNGLSPKVFSIGIAYHFH